MSKFFLWYSSLIRIINREYGAVEIDFVKIMLNDSLKKTNFGMYYEMVSFDGLDLEVVRGWNKMSCVFDLRLPNVPSKEKFIWGSIGLTHESWSI